MFAFEDIARFPTKHLRGALQTVDREELAVALRTAGREVRRRIFSGLSLSGARRVRQEMERIGPVRLSDVEAAQQQIVEVLSSVDFGEYRCGSAGPGKKRSG